MFVSAQNPPGEVTHRELSAAASDGGSQDEPGPGFELKTFGRTSDADSRRFRLTHEPGPDQRIHPGRDRCTGQSGHPGDVRPGVRLSVPDQLKYITSCDRRHSATHTTASPTVSTRSL